MRLKATAVAVSYSVAKIMRSQSNQSMRTAAVLVPFFRRDGEDLCFVLVRRGERGIHGGQLGFPGGKPDPEDDSMLDTALRETEEEIGLPSPAIEVIETRVS